MEKTRVDQGLPPLIGKVRKGNNRGRQGPGNYKGPGRAQAAAVVPLVPPGTDHRVEIGMPGTNPFALGFPTAPGLAGIAYPTITRGTAAQSPAVSSGSFGPAQTTQTLMPQTMLQPLTPVVLLGGR